MVVMQCRALRPERTVVPSSRLTPNAPARRWQPSRQTLCRFREQQNSETSTDQVIKENGADAVDDKASKKAAAVDQIDWRNSWWPVYPLDSLPTDRPFGLTVLGLDVVVWRDLSGKFRVFEDSCPHRKVALSEGRIETDGTLQCSYHGWRFNSEGKCTTIPQIDSSAKSERICASAPACATAFPTMEGNGLLWVWMTPGASPDAPDSSSVPGQEGYAPALNTGSWYAREMPMSWEVLMENIVDMSHLPFAHHGVIGNRNSPWTPAWNMEGHGVKGYVLTESGPSPMKFELDMTKFPSAYSLNRGSESFKDADDDFLALKKPSLRLLFHAIPVTRTSSRVIYREEASFPLQPQAPLSFKLKPPEWYQQAQSHLNRSEVLDGDMVFLNRVALKIEAGEVSPYSDYFTPADTDKTVRVLWNYLRKHAKDGISYYPHKADLMPVAPEDALNRYEQHTKNCSICSKALHNLRMGMTAAEVAAALMACTAVVLLGRDYVPVGAPVALFALSGAAVAGRQALQKLEKKFVYTGYTHAERD